MFVQVRLWKVKRKTMIRNLYNQSPHPTLKTILDVLLLGFNLSALPKTLSGVDLFKTVNNPSLAGKTIHLALKWGYSYLQPLIDLADFSLKFKRYGPCFSSPEHEVLMVSYCDQSLSLVRRASSVVRRQQFVLKANSS